MTFATIVSQPTGKVLDVPGGTSDHVPIQQIRNNNGGGLGTPNQQWFAVPITRNEDDVLEVGHFIVSRSTGQLLRVRDEDWQRQARPVHIFQDFHVPADQQAQSWATWDNPDGSVSIFSMLANRDVPNPEAIDVPADQLQNDGAKIQLWPFHGGPNQRWILVQQDITVYAMFSRANRQVMDVPAFSHGDELVHQNQYNGGPNQTLDDQPTPLGRSVSQDYCGAQ